MKLSLCLLSFIITSFVPVFAQTEKDNLLKQDVSSLVEEMEFMYGYDQIMREYTTYKTFDKGEVNKIETLSDSLRAVAINTREFTSANTNKLIWENYINPKDDEHTKRIIEITKKYGFPSTVRIKKYYSKGFIDPEFNPFLFLIHSPKKYWDELKVLMKEELNEGRINRCTYGYLLWHVNGRKDLKYMLDNGYKMVKENGVSVMKAVDCD